MYPHHLELQYQKYCIGRFEDFNRRLLGKILPWLKAHIEKTRPVAPAQTGQVKQDAPGDDIFEFLEKLREEYDGWIPAEVMEGAIARNFNLINAWSRDKITESIETLMTRLETPQPPSVTGRPTPIGKSGEKWLTTIDLLNRESGLVQTQVDRIVRTNLNLIKSLQGEHFNDVHQVITDGLGRGDSLKTMTDGILQSVDINRNRAKFWAHDQASKFFGEVTKTRQTDAGIPGYIWRITGVRTRAEHRAVANQYFEWTKPPRAGVRGNHVHPGEDFRCRCWPEPAFGPEYADIETEPLPDISQQTEFIPSKTKNDAELYIRGIGVAANDVNYSGLNIETINRINKSLFDIKRQYPFIRSILLTETYDQYSAGGGSYRRLMINKKNFFNKIQNAAAYDQEFKDKMRRNYERAKKDYNLILQSGDNKLISLAKLELDTARVGNNFKRYGVLAQNKEHESVIYHEYGHILSDQVYGMINGINASPIANKAFIDAFKNEWKELYLKLLNTNDIFNISFYSMKSESECFAECFTMYHLELNNLPVYVKDFIRKYFDNFTPGY